MLQQTQTYRVEPKYVEFIRVFPTIESLADASFTQVLRYWKGLGYNRRARYLHQCAQAVVQQYGGVMPSDPSLLQELPGIGSYTSCAVSTFAYNQPHVFIETNIRAVFIAHFFQLQEKVTDKEIMPIIEQALDTERPREWYYALMDYGVHLKQQGNPNKKSAHYTKQSKFEGSTRQVRGLILERLLQHKNLEVVDLFTQLDKNEEQMSTALAQLIAEKLVVYNGQLVQLAE